MRVAVGNDHAGYPLRAPLIELIESSGHQVVSFGTDNEHPVDYPRFAANVARAVRDGQADLGVVICGTGIGSSIRHTTRIKKTLSAKSTAKISCF